MGSGDKKAGKSSTTKKGKKKPGSQKDNTESASSSIKGRRKKKFDNRKKILNAALKVFSTIGLGNSNVRDIIRESDLSIGTFYNNFETKEDVFVELVNDFIKILRVRLRNARRNANDSFSFVTLAYKSFFDIFTDNPDLLALIARNQSSFRNLAYQDEAKNLIEDLESDIRLAIEAGLLPDIPVRVVSLSMFGTGLEIMAHGAAEKKIDTEATARALGILFVRGLEGFRDNPWQ